jgi:hypothetical protein
MKCRKMLILLVILTMMVSSINCSIKKTVAFVICAPVERVAPFSGCSATIEELGGPYRDLEHDPYYPNPIPAPFEEGK